MQKEVTGNMVYSTLVGMISEKRAARIMPEHVTFLEIRQRIPEMPDIQMRNVLNNLFKAGLIKTGRTINDIYIIINR